MENQAAGPTAAGAPSGEVLMYKGCFWFINSLQSGMIIVSHPPSLLGSLRNRGHVSPTWLPAPERGLSDFKAGSRQSQAEAGSSLGVVTSAREAALAVVGGWQVVGTQLPAPTS